MLGAAIVPSVALLVGMAFMPETPRFLVHTGEEDQARDVLESVRPDEPAEREIGAIRDVEEQVSDAGIRELGAKWVRPALLVAIGLGVFQQFIGINTIVYYAPTTLTKVGYGNTGAIYANIIIGVLMVAATVVAVRVIDRIGRKPLLLWRVVGMGTSLAVLGIGSAILATPKHPGDPAAISPWPGSRVPGLCGDLWHRLCVRVEVRDRTKGRSLEQIESDLQETTGVDGDHTESGAANAAPAESRTGRVAG
jgi:MFS family permease